MNIGMRIKPLASLVLLLTGTFGMAGNLEIDFNNGISPAVRLYDLDGNTPSRDLEFTGLKAGIPWTACDVEKTGRRVAVSTSWYSPAGTSDDWMVLPRVEVTEDSELRWNARAFDENLPDGYAVYVSEQGDTPEDFDRTDPVFSTNAENAEWTSRSVKLSRFAGKCVNIAFVNDSHDRNMLLIDHIYVGAPEKADIFLEERSIGVPGDVVPLKFRVTTSLDEGIALKGAGCSFDGTDVRVTLSGMKVCKDSPATILFPDASVVIGENMVTEVNVWIESDKGRVEKTVRIGNYRRAMVAEEGTGTWCKWCVRGIYAFETLKDKYPERFIGIAVHENDPMMVPGYTPKGSGNPRAVLNREGDKMDPADLDDAISAHLGDVPPVALRADYSVSGDAVNVRAYLIPGVETVGQTWRAAFVVLEDDVHVTDIPGYDQKNAYAGGNEGPMGGFEDLPEVIPAEQMWYQDVARGIFPDMRGLVQAFPDHLYSGEEALCDYTFTMPASVINAEKTRIAVLILDGSQNIVNACIAVPGETGGTDRITVLPAVDKVLVGTSYYDLYGRRIPVTPERGIYIVVREYSDGSRTASKSTF